MSSSEKPTQDFGVIGGKIVEREVAESWERSMSERTRKLLQRSDETGYCAGCEMIRENDAFYHHDYKQLVQSASAGCPLCRLLSEVSVGRHVRGNPSCRININYKANKLYHSIYDAGEIALELFIPRENSPDNSNVIKLRDIQLDPASEDCYSLAQSWLKNCVENHSRCGQTNESPLPTRLLDIDGDQVRLRLSADIPEKAPKYATLSYCWGSQRELITTSKTLANHQQEILAENLPKSLDDAVTVTRRLGLRYLWVDSLCILQDSVGDWKAECARMGDYYRHSFLTISALDSSDAHQGFLYPRPDATTAPLLPGGDIWVRTQLPGRQKVFNNAALSQRGWALQERLLSTRIIHFSKSELFWECLTCSSREGSIIEHTQAVDSHSLVDSDGEDFKRASFNLGDDPYSIKDGAFALWYRLVKQYTKRSLTRSSDILSAISGLATTIGAHTNSLYSAGIWEHDLHSLAWSREAQKGENVSDIDSQGRQWAPSWSWARVGGPVSYRFYEEERTRSENDAKLIKMPVGILQAEDSYNIFGSYTTTTALVKEVNGMLVWSPIGILQVEHCLRNCLTIKALFKQVQCLQGWVDARKHIANFVPSSGDLETYTPPGTWWIYAYRGNFTYMMYNLNGEECGAASLDKYSEEEKLHECTAIWIGERAYERREEHKEPVRETAVYMLLIVPDNKIEGCWRRIGVGVTGNHSTIPSVDYSDVFKGAEWATIKLI